jgi:hypothetical protein
MTLRFNGGNMVILALVLILASIGLLAAIEWVCRCEDKRYKAVNQPTEPI